MQGAAVQQLLLEVVEGRKKEEEGGGGRVSLRNSIFHMKACQESKEEEEEKEEEEGEGALGLGSRVGRPCWRRNRIIAYYFRYRY